MPDLRRPSRDSRSVRRTLRAPVLATLVTLAFAASPGSTEAARSVEPFNAAPASVGVAVGSAMVALAPTGGEPAASEAGAERVIGYSVQGRPIHIACRGEGVTVLFVGGMHTGPEAITSDLATDLATLAWTTAPVVPEGARLCVIPTLNPDGVALGLRTNVRGVDLNRNWPALNWESIAWHPLSGQVGAGSEPLSEPETRALWDYVLETRPAAVFVWHCCGAVVEANDGTLGSEFGRAYALASGLDYIEHWSEYAITGQFIDSMDRIGVTALDIEMVGLEDLRTPFHLAAVRAALTVAAAGPARPSAPSALASVPRPTATVAVPGGDRYRVQPGDTIAMIAIRLGVSPHALVAVNGIVQPDLIEVGQVLALPGS